MRKDQSNAGALQPFLLPERIAKDVAQVVNLNEKIKNNLHIIDVRRDTGDVQHQVLFLTLVRVVKYAEGYCLLVKNGYGEPAASLLRSIFEALLWMRWSLIKHENAEVYFQAGKGEAVRLAKTMENIMRRITGSSVSFDRNIFREIHTSEINR